MFSKVPSTSKGYHSWFHLLSAPKTQPYSKSLLRGLPTSLKYIKASASCKDEVQGSFNSKKTSPLKLTCQPQTLGTPHLGFPMPQSALSVQANIRAPKIREMSRQSYGFHCSQYLTFGLVYGLILGYIHALVLGRGCVGRSTSKDKRGEEAPCSQTALFQTTLPSEHCLSHLGAETEFTQPTCNPHALLLRSTGRAKGPVSLSQPTSQEVKGPPLRISQN